MWKTPKILPDSRVLIYRFSQIDQLDPESFVSKNQPSQKSEKPKEPTQSSSILSSSKSKELFETGRFSDASLVVHGQEFKVHKAILSMASPVFAAMFEKAEAKSESKFEIPNLSVENCKRMLRYIYSGELDESGKNLVELFLAADQVWNYEPKNKPNSVMQMKF